MRSLILQLSDIHFRESGNAVAAKRQAIVEAVRNLEPDAQCCLVLLTGDIAFSGSDSEYMIAYEFIDSLLGGLRSELVNRPPVYVAAIPGNHDCNLQTDQAARDLLRAGLANHPPERVDASIVEACTQVQRLFFDLRDTVSDSSMLHHPGRLYYEYRIHVGAEYIEVRCLNTAWLSQIHETQGSLYFPAAELPPKNAEASLAISMLHHPFSWLPVENRRVLQQALEQVSDIIFTGHEHAHTRRTQVVSTGEVNEFIEGAALQVHGDSDESSFNTLVVDTGRREQRFFRFEWSPDGQYQPITRGDWEAFQVNRLRARAQFQVNEAVASLLEDPGAAFEKSGHGRVSLSQIFVFPEFRQVSFNVSDGAPTLKGEDIFDESLSTPNVVISGPEQSGKTCLAKMVFRRFRQKGLVPLLIDGAQFTPQRGSRLHEQLYRLFAEQYHTDALEAFRQLVPARRVVIIDNFHKVTLRPGHSQTLVRDLESFAGRTVLFSNDLAYAVGEIARAGEVIQERPSYRHFRILPFGFAKRQELTAKWFMLPGNVDDHELARQLSEAEDRMEVVLGKNFVPAFPIFILAMLQGLDSLSEVDVNASTYGYFYELLIKAALLRGSTQQEFHIRVTYLTRLAFHLFTSRRRDITEGELRAFHTEYEKATDLPTSFTDITNALQQRLILVRSADTFEFKYDYCYYYFVARHLERNIAVADTRTRIEMLSDDLANEEYANILLFLVHLTDDPIVVEPMLRSADKHYGSLEPARLEDDVAFLNQISSSDPLELEYEGKDYLEVRHDLARARDEMARSQEHLLPESAIPSEEAMLAVQPIVRDLQASLKVLQILGQVLKNHPALHADTKERIASTCYRLGFRTLASVLKLLDEGKESIVEMSMAALREDRPQLGEQRIRVAANSVVYGLGLLSACGVVKSISIAVGSQYLKKTYEKVAASMGTNATNLVNMSIRLDQVRGFPRGEIVLMNQDLVGVSKAVLKWLVWTHVNLFPVPLEDRQKVFAALGIKYSPKIGANPARRLLAPGRGEP